jgi:hypothetical protein
MENIFGEQPGLCEIEEPKDSDSRALIHSDIVALKREDPSFLISAAAGYQACQGILSLDINPISMLPLSPPDSPRPLNSTFRRSGRSYIEAASVEFAGEVFSSRISKDTESKSPEVTPRTSRMFTDADLSPRYTKGRRFRRSSRIMLDDADEKRPEFLDTRRARRSSLEMHTESSIGRVLPAQDRRSMRFRALAQQII